MGRVWLGSASVCKWGLGPAIPRHPTIPDPGVAATGLPGAVPPPVSPYCITLRYPGQARQPDALQRRDERLRGNVPLHPLPAVAGLLQLRTGEGHAGATLFKSERNPTAQTNPTVKLKRSRENNRPPPTRQLPAHKSRVRSRSQEATISAADYTVEVSGLSQLGPAEKLHSEIEIADFFALEVLLHYSIPF